jgi:Ca2+-binding RTX toxin-like protein
MAARLFLAVLVTGLLWPTPAPGATVSMEGLMVVFTAGPGEANVLDVRLDGTAVVYSDGAAEITDFPAGVCARRAPGTVACDPSSLGPQQFSTRVELRDGNDRGTLDLPFLSWLDGGDGDDTLTVSTTTTTAPVEGLGGPGDDVIVGGSGYEILRGGDGQDQLAAGPGGAQLEGGPGRDRLTGGDSLEMILGGGDADTIVAGAGDDFIYGDADLGVEAADQIDAGPGDDRVFAGGGNDRVTGGPGADHLVGGDGADRMAGGEGDDRLDGAAGNDRATGDAGRDRVSGDAGDDRLTGGADNDVLLGGDGDDRLTMGPGRDRADGEADDDLVLGRDGVRAAIECGTGEDTATPDTRDRVHLDCETISQPVRCRRRCRATGTLTTKRGVVLGRGAIRLPARRTRSLRVPLSAKGSNAVRRAGKLHAWLVVETGRRSTLTRFSLHTSL